MRIRQLRKVVFAQRRLVAVAAAVAPGRVLRRTLNRDIGVPGERGVDQALLPADRRAMKGRAVR